MSTHLRPRSVWELLDGAVRILREHYASFVVLGIITSGPMWIILVAAGWASFYGAMSNATPDQLAAMRFPSTGPWLAVALLLAALWWFVTDAAVVALASDAYLGREVVPARALGRVLSRAPTIIAARILKGLLLLLAYICIFIPVFYAAARYFAVVPAAVLEEGTATASLHRSRDLSKDFKWRILGGLILAFVIYLIVASTLRAVTGLFPAPPVVLGVLDGVAAVLVYPLVGIMVTLLYYDQRIRKEAFDLEVLAAQIGGAAPTPSPAPAGD